MPTYQVEIYGADVTPAALALRVGQTAGRIVFEAGDPPLVEPPLSAQGAFEAAATYTTGDVVFDEADGRLYRADAYVEAGGEGPAAAVSGASPSALWSLYARALVTIENRYTGLVTVERQEAPVTALAPDQVTFALGDFFALPGEGTYDLTLAVEYAESGHVQAFPAEAEGALRLQVGGPYRARLDARLEEARAAAAEAAALVAPARVALVDAAFAEAAPPFFGSLGEALVHARGLDPPPAAGAPVLVRCFYDATGAPVVPDLSSLDGYTPEDGDAYVLARSVVHPPGTLLRALVAGRAVDFSEARRPLDLGAVRAPLDLA